MTDDLPKSTKEFNATTREFREAMEAIGAERGTELYSEARDEFCDFVKEVCQKAECDHEQVTTNFNTSEGRTTLTELIDRTTEGGYLATYKVTCTDCGAVIPAQLRLDIKREEY
jgi:hypothetical protein